MASEQILKLPNIFKVFKYVFFLYNSISIEYEA